MLRLASDSIYMVTFILTLTTNLEVSPPSAFSREITKKIPAVTAGIFFLSFLSYVLCLIYDVSPYGLTS